MGSQTRLPEDEGRPAPERRVSRDARRQREAARELLAECRRDLRQALAELQPDAAAVLELSVQERLLQERLARLPARAFGWFALR
jgi:hypothetical protein